MGIYTHWGGAGNGAAGVNWGVYRPPTEQGRTVHWKSYYHGILSSGGAEARTAPIQAMVGGARSGYPGYKGGTCRNLGVEGVGGGELKVEGEVKG